MQQGGIYVVEALAKSASRLKYLEVFQVSRPGPAKFLGYAFQVPTKLDEEKGLVEIAWRGGVLAPEDREAAKARGPLGWDKYLQARTFGPADGGRDAAINFVWEKGVQL